MTGLTKEDFEAGIKALKEEIKRGKAISMTNPQNVTIEVPYRRLRLASRYDYKIMIAAEDIKK